MRVLSATVRARLRRLQSRIRSDKNVYLVCDEPQSDAVVVSDAVLVRGWAHSMPGIAGVEVRLNETTIEAQVGLARPDVARALDDAGAVRAGWQVAFPAAEVKLGSNTLSIVARDHRGRIARDQRSFTWRAILPGENPYEQVDLSGERYDPRYPHVNSVAIEHHARYRLAASFAAGRRVLDAGCGFGYGAAVMARAGAVGVDAIDAHSSVVAQAKLTDRSGVRFEIGDLRALPYPDDSFDMVVCFEVLEHVDEHGAVLDELKRVLHDDGLLVISTPNKGVYPAGNPWHLRELTTDEFAAELRDRFSHVSLLGQQLHLATLLADEQTQSNASAEDTFLVEALKMTITKPGGEVFSVAIATDGELPPAPTLIALGDPRDALVEATIGGWTERALRAEAEVAMLRTQRTMQREYGVQPFEPLPAPGPTRRAEEVATELREELSRPPQWMYEWDLASSGVVQIPEELASIHSTRLELIAPAVEATLQQAGDGATVLDLACCEGWFAHRVLELGAQRVVAVDVRETNVRRAELMRDHLGISPDRLQVVKADAFSLPDLGQFDVVLCLGLIYHVENPVGLMRILRALTRRLCVVESQLTEQRGPIMAGNGAAGLHFPRDESFAGWYEEDQASNQLASHGGILSFIPNEAALLTMGRVAGFADVAVSEPQPHMSPAYVQRERAVMLARTD